MELELREEEGVREVDEDRNYSSQLGVGLHSVDIRIPLLLLMDRVELELKLGMELEGSLVAVEELKDRGSCTRS